MKRLYFLLNAVACLLAGAGQACTHLPPTPAASETASHRRDDAGLRGQLRARTVPAPGSAAPELARRPNAGRAQRPLVRPYVVH
jgi:hypothetical protein